MSIDPVSLAIEVGLTAVNMALTASKTIEGQRLTDLSVTVADYGTPANYFKGIRRFDGTPIIWAEKLREIKKQSKTKGGKYNDYKYDGTFAFMIAMHQIDGVTRIWLDKHLVYDATGAGPMTPFSAADGFNLLESMRIYLGTEDQMPDPRMQATVEAAHGAGSCPAYRGVAYVVFEELPLEKFGNRIPQISVEAITSGSPHYPYESFEPRPTADGFTYSTDFSRFLVIAYPAYEIWDVAARRRIISGDLPASMSGGAGYGISKAGTIYTMGADHRSIQVFSPDGLSLQGTITGMTVDQARIVVRADGLGREHLLTQHDFYDTYYSMVLGGISGLVEGVISDETGYSFTPKFYFSDSHGDIWMVGTSLTELFLYRVVDTEARPGSSGFARIVVPDPALSLAQAWAAHYGDRFVVQWNQLHLYSIDETTMEIVDTASAPGGGYTDWFNLMPGSASIWLGMSQVSLADLTTIRTVHPLDWKTEDVNVSTYDPVNNALICWPQYADNITWRYLDRVGSDGVMLGDVVDDVAARVGIAPGDIDTSALTQIVKGWSWTQGSGKDILSPLLDLYDVDPREHGFVLGFLPRGGAIGSTIDMTAFVTGEQDGEATHTIERGQATDTPRRLTLSFSDVAADQQTNSASVARPLERVNGARELSIDMTPWASDVDTGHQFAARLLRRRWFGRETYTNGLTAQHIALEPGDVHALSFDGVTKAARLTLMAKDADEVLRLEWERDDPSVALLNGQAGAGFDGRAPSVILVATPSKGFVLDLPLIRDADNDINPLLYYAASPYVTGTWPGASILRSLDGGATYEEEWASVPSSAPATWGYASDVLADADPWLWDRGNDVTITLQYGSLTGATEAECDANPLLNLAALGGELLQFTSATLNGDGTWTLSGLKRGRRGTEGACGGHAAGEGFVLMAATGRVAMGASDVGDTEYFKAVTAGRDAAGAFVTSLGFTGATLKPYAPAQLRAVKDAGSGDWAIDWVRRSRIGGAWTGGTTVPLGEASEEYAVEILDGGGVVVRTYSGLTSASATYDAADQAADGGDVAAGDLHLRVYQISDTVGRGFAASGNF